MSRAALLGLWAKVRRAGDRLAIYLPLLLMGLLAMSTYWLLRQMPNAQEAAQAAPARHVPDYFLRDFSVKVFDANGQLKSEVIGQEGRHFPDTDTLEVDQPRITLLGQDGQRTTARAARALINADGSQVQLFDKAVVVREAQRDTQGVSRPRSELQSDFLHVLADVEQVRTHLPVVLLRGAGERFVAQGGLRYDNLAQVIELEGRVRGTLAPPKN